MPAISREASINLLPYAFAPRAGTPGRRIVGNERDHAVTIAEQFLPPVLRGPANTGEHWRIPSIVALFRRPRFARLSAKLGNWLDACNEARMAIAAFPTVPPMHFDRKAGSFAVVFQRGYPLTIRFLRSRGANREIAEEIAQAAWARGWELQGQLRCAESLQPWINGIAKNLLRAHQSRAAGTCSFDGSTPLTNAWIPAQRKLGLEARLDLQRALNERTRQERALFQQFYDAGYSTEEIARQMGLTPVAVRIRLHRLRLVLRSVLHEPPPARRRKPGPAAPSMR